MSNTEPQHKSVLLNEALDGLNIEPGKTYVDCTVGLGGHSEEILKRLDGTGKLIGFEQDKEAYEYAKKKLEKYENCQIINSNFINLEKSLRSINLSTITGGLILDLGVSSLQLDSADRGFSFLKEGPLDMRMNQDNDLSAYEIVNKYGEKELADIIYNYGEERHSRKIAKAITNNRPINTTTELANIIKKCIFTPKKLRIHPATRTFQALRIFVNNELKILEEFLCFIPELLSSKGRLSVISFHSLEDRITKHTLRNSSELSILTKKPIIPSPEETRMNSRARSAKLRIAEKI